MHVELIDFMGSDERVVDSARVSFDKIAANYTNEQNEGLIKYLAKHNHFTPFTHCVITMRETVPIFVARQRFKHMVGFTYNEVSRRYVSDTPEFFMPDKWRLAPENAKQGSAGDHPNSQFWDNRVEDHHINCELLYEAMIRDNVAPEQARMVLPQSMYTSYYVTGSLFAWARAYNLRIDSHAQVEIQNLAKQWDIVISNIPKLEHSWKALKNEHL